MGVEAAGGALPLDQQGANQPLQLQMEETPNPSASFDGLVQESASALFSGPHGGPDGHGSESPSRVFRSEEAGSLTDAKKEFISDATGPGAERASKKAEVDRQAEALTDRARQLYSDMTVYHVAWGIAMRVQKDISHLLKAG
ncbi:hypothetical protein [Yoonia sp. SS1-5]|uniref:Uncharacterized protein n=1 Tax=Yoonia rhodophyticola TaxID=3137370 RepID=A0ABZ3JD10_9RHOB